MLSFFRIARNTFLESVREPIFFIMLYCAFFIIGNMPGLTLFVFFQQLKMVIDSSLATTMVGGMLILTLSAGNTVGREMRNGTVLLLMSKPVPRYVFISAKICGIIFTGAVFCFLCNMATFISVFTASDQFWFNTWTYVGFFVAVFIAAVFGLFMNFWRNSSFSEMTVKAALVILPVMAIVCRIFCEKPEVSLPNVSSAMVLVFFSVAIMGTLAVIFAVKFDVVANLVLCSVMFFAGLMSNYLFNPSEPKGNIVLDTLSDFFYSVLPNWQYFWMADSVALGRMIPGIYLIHSLGYTLLYIVICSLWAMALFHTCEIAKDAR